MVRSWVRRRNCPSSIRNGNPPKWSPVQVAQHHGLDQVWINVLLAQGGQAGSPAVDEHGGRPWVVIGEGHAGLKPAT